MTRDWQVTCTKMSEVESKNQSYCINDSDDEAYELYFPNIGKGLRGKRRFLLLQRIFADARLKNKNETRDELHLDKSSVQGEKRTLDLAAVHVSKPRYFFD